MNDALRWIRTSSIAAALSVAALVPAVGAPGRARMPHVRSPQVQAPHAAARRGAAPRSMGSAYYHRGYNRNAMANQNNAPMLSQLHATMATLARADHDYQGHRVRAMQQVGTAIRHLEPPAVRRNQANPAAAYMASPTAAGAAAGNPNRMPQAQSDGHLRNALQSLNTMQAQLANYGTTPSHVRAHASVQNAIRELNVALNVK